MTEQYFVSARKYRPNTFSSIVGQDYIIKTLKNAIKNNKIAQAFLFYGPRGVGKTTTARIFAKTINCLNITPDIEPCNQCEVCRSFDQLTSFNILELDAASNNSVDDIRTLIEQVRIPPQTGKYKIYIIDETHMLSQSAFNAFLKTLEEPPAYTKFILATTEKHKIPPTILSRCQIFDFKRISIEDIATHLAKIAQIENINYEQQALYYIASKSDGALRDALSIFDQMTNYTSGNITTKDVITNLNILDYEHYFRFIDDIIEQNIYEILIRLDDIYSRGFDGLHVINGLAEHIRNLMLCKNEKTSNLLSVHESIIQKYLNQSQKTTTQFLIKALDILSYCDINYKNVSNKRFFVELTLLKLIQNVNDTINISPHQNPDQSKDIQKKYTENQSSSVSQDMTSKANISSSIKENIYSANEIQKINIQSDPFISINKLLQTPNSNNTNQTTQKDFTDEDVYKAFEMTKKELKDTLKNFEYEILSKASLTKIEDKFIISVESNFQLETLRSIDLIQRLKKHLQNYEVKIELKVSKQNNSQKIKTLEEKNKDFLANNPIILKFIEDTQAFISY